LVIASKFRQATKQIENILRFSLLTFFILLYTYSKIHCTYLPLISLSHTPNPHLFHHLLLVSKFYFPYSLSIFFIMHLSWLCPVLPLFFRLVNREVITFRGPALYLSGIFGVGILSLFFHFESFIFFRKSNNVAWRLRLKTSVYELLKFNGISNFLFYRNTVVHQW